MVMVYRNAILWNVPFETLVPLILKKRRGFSFAKTSTDLISAHDLSTVYNSHSLFFPSLSAMPLSMSFSLCKQVIKLDLDLFYMNTMLQTLRRGFF